MMSNIVDELLRIDFDDLEVPSTNKKIYLKKLKKHFVFPCVALDVEKANEIQISAVEISNDGLEEINMFKLQANTVVEGCKEVFKNKVLMDNFKAPTPIELIRRLLLDGELQELYSTITGLSSCIKGKDEEIKN